MLQHYIVEHCGGGHIVVGLQNPVLSEKLQIDLTLDKAVSVARQTEAIKLQHQKKLKTEARQISRQLEHLNQIKEERCV